MSSALFIRTSTADMFPSATITMRRKDNAGLLSDVPEPATGGAAHGRSLIHTPFEPSNPTDDFVAVVRPGSSLGIFTTNIFNAGSSINMNGFIEWEEDQ